MAAVVAMKIAAFAVLVFAACAAASTEMTPLGPRASFDLECPLEKMKSTRLGDNTWGASGCGRRAVYQWVCTSEDKALVPNGGGGYVVVDGKSCMWVRN